jgi:hypothetical protein
LDKGNVKAKGAGGMRLLQSETNALFQETSKYEAKMPVTSMPSDINPLKTKRICFI